MDEIATLGLFAQLAVALTGFAGLLTAFRSRREGWLPIEVAGIKILLMTSVAAMGFSALPVPMLVAGWSVDRAFGLSSVLLGAHFIVAFAAGLHMVLKKKLRPRRPVLFWIFTAALIPMAALLFLSAFGVLAPGAGLYCAGLLFLLVVATAQFLFQVLASITQPAGEMTGDRLS